MNRQTADILLALLAEPYQSQRGLARRSGYALGTVNSLLKELISEGCIDEKYNIMQKGYGEISRNSPQSAIILAAGYGMRMVPINTASPKALLKVKGEVLIERLIRQLHQAGIKQISVVVGFMKESFEYLIDRYGVELIVNPQYASRNNLHSLALAANRIGNSYIIPSDIWCEENPFQSHELYSWYMVSDSINAESNVRVNRKQELVRRNGQRDGNTMVGIAYIGQKDAEPLRQKLKTLDGETAWNDFFWEEALYEKGKMMVQAKVIPAGTFFEINTYEQLREIDEGSSWLKSDAMMTICRVLDCSLSDIQNVAALKKGMTNRSFAFSCRGNTYIMRIPGEGTDELINRYQEAAVYQAIAGKQLCDDPVYIEPKTGYKITRFIDGVRCCDPQDPTDLRKCMRKLREFHEMGLQVDHFFDLFQKIDFYESLWVENSSAYADYFQTKKNVLSLRAYVEQHRGPFALTHIDAVPDNFLFAPDGSEAIQLQLTDWEYAGMQDPHVDIAMFCIYALYNREQIDALMELYFDGAPNRETRIKIYCYIAICGLLWSNWCEYKRQLGVEFGEYSLRQYRYAKDYYEIALEEMRK